MSYKYGTNGNDLNWDAMQSLSSICVECEHQRVADGYYNMGDEQQEEYDESHDCQDHNIVYYEFQTVSTEPYVTTEMQVCDWFKLSHQERHEKMLDTILDWFIIHETNDNFVQLVGDVPDEYLTEHYVKDRNEAESIEATFEAEECYHE